MGYIRTLIIRHFRTGPCPVERVEFGQQRTANARLFVCPDLAVEIPLYRSSHHLAIWEGITDNPRCTNAIKSLENLVEQLNALMLCPNGHILLWNPLLCTLGFGPECLSHKVVEIFKQWSLYNVQTDSSQNTLPRLTLVVTEVF